MANSVHGVSLRTLSSPTAAVAELSRGSMLIDQLPPRSHSSDDSIEETEEKEDKDDKDEFGEDETDEEDEYRKWHPLLYNKTGEDVLVDFSGPDDPDRALNWSPRRKLSTTLLYALITACTTWTTSIYSSAIPDVAKEFHVSEVVATLGTTLYLLGLGFGPLLFAPISELYGRKLAAQIPFFVGICFVFGSATAENFQTLMICRFFSGFFASAPLVNTGGVVADLYSVRQRAAAVAVYQVSVVGGPLISPVVGGAIVDSSLSWRWTLYITGILMLACLAVHVTLVSETLSSAILTSRARKLRFRGGNYALHAKHEEWEVSIAGLARKYLIVPFRLLLTPICFLMCLYVGFAYSMIYLLFTVFPIEYQEIRGFNALVGSLPFLGVLVGCLIGSAINFGSNKLYISKLEANNGRPVPEARLYPMMLGGVFLVAGLFLFGWTSSKDILWVGPVFGGALLGVAFITIFSSATNYLVDTFTKYSASAVAVNTVIRSLLAGGFPLFSSAMFHNLGVDWASSLLGFIAVLMVPIPFLLYIYGRRIRARGKWSRDSL